MKSIAHVYPHWWRFAGTALFFFLALSIQAQENRPFDDPKPSETKSSVNEPLRARKRRPSSAESVPAESRSPLVLRDPPNENEVTIYDEFFKKNFEAFEAQFGRARRELSVRSDASRATQPEPNGNADSRKVTSCMQLADLPDDYRFGGTTTKHQPEIDYPDCFALAVARFGKRSKHSFFDLTRPGHDVFKSLKVYDLHSELSQLSSVDANTMLKDVAIHSLNVERSLIELKCNWGGGNGMTYRIDILASADFDEDGIEDLLVMHTERTWQGSYFVQVPKVLCRKSHGGKLEFKNHDFLLTCLRSCQNKTSARPVETKGEGD